MFTSVQSRANAYSRIAAETSVQGASPHQLVGLLYDALLQSIASARGALARKDIEAKGMAIGKAVRISEEGLKAGLNLEEGGEIAAIAAGGAYLDGLSSSAPDMLDDEAPADEGERPEPEVMPEAVIEKVEAEAEAPAADEDSAARETPAPKRPRRSRARKAEPKDEPVSEATEDMASLPEPEIVPAAVAAEAAETATPQADSEPAMAEAEAPPPAPEVKAAPAAQPDGPKKTGWWNRSKK